MCFHSSPQKASIRNSPNEEIPQSGMSMRQTWTFRDRVFLFFPFIFEGRRKLSASISQTPNEKLIRLFYTMSTGPDPLLEPPIYVYGESTWRSQIANAQDTLTRIGFSTLETYKTQPIWKKAVLLLLGVIVGIIGVLLVVYHEPLLEIIVEYSDKWSQSGWSPVILASLLFIISFPPLIGFSFTSTVVGCLFGISFKGWFIIAFGSFTGSVAAFVLFRYVLKSKAHALIHANEKLYAFSNILEDNNSYWLLVLIRLCPFPYSLTNGALAAIPGITIINFALGSLISSPKLVLYLFIGTKLKDIGNTTDTATRLFDILSIFMTMLFLFLTGWILYAKTNDRLKQLQAARTIPHANNDSDAAHYEDDFNLEEPAV